MNFNDLKKDLSGYPTDKIVFVGLGNQMRKDDAAGLIITEKIEKSAIFSSAHFIQAYTTPESHLEEILRYNPNSRISDVLFYMPSYWKDKFFSNNRIQK